MRMAARVFRQQTDRIEQVPDARRAGLPDEVLVMYSGKIVESAPIAELFSDPPASLYNRSSRIHPEARH